MARFIDIYPNGKAYISTITKNKSTTERYTNKVANPRAWSKEKSNPSIIDSDYEEYKLKAFPKNSILDDEWEVIGIKDTNTTMITKDNKKEPLDKLIIKQISEENVEHRTKIKTLKKTIKTLKDENKNLTAEVKALRAQLPITINPDEVKSKSDMMRRFETMDIG